jgi:hypothetical protein
VFFDFAISAAWFQRLSDGTISMINRLIGRKKKEPDHSIDVPRRVAELAAQTTSMI